MNRHLLTNSKKVFQSSSSFALKLKNYKIKLVSQICKFSEYFKATPFTDPFNWTQVLASLLIGCSVDIIATQVNIKDNEGKNSEEEILKEK